MALKNFPLEVHGSETYLFKEVQAQRKWQLALCHCGSDTSKEGGGPEANGGVLALSMDGCYVASRPTVSRAPALSREAGNLDVYVKASDF